MISSIMRSLLLILVVCAFVINSDARTLAEQRHPLGAFNRRPHEAPPPPNSEPPSGVDIPFLESSNDCVRRRATPPPPPKPATPVIPVIEMITSRPCELEKLMTVENYGKKGRLPPPAPADAPPTHQVSSGGAAGFEQSSPNVLLSSG